MGKVRAKEVPSGVAIVVRLVTRRAARMGRPLFFFLCRCYRNPEKDSAMPAFCVSPAPLRTSLFQLQHESWQRRFAHICCRRDHVSRRLTEFAQVFVGHLPEPRSQCVDVQGYKLDGLHYGPPGSLTRTHAGMH